MYSGHTARDGKCKRGLCSVAALLVLNMAKETAEHMMDVKQNPSRSSSPGKLLAVRRLP
jgi:hypothetical protein